MEGPMEHGKNMGRLTLKDIDLGVGDSLTPYKFHVLSGFVLDATADQKRLSHLTRTLSELREELAQKTRLLEESSQTITELRGREATDVSKFKADTATQLRSQCDRIVSLNATVQSLTAKNAALDSELMELQCREREQGIANERLTGELERLTKELDVYRSSAGAMLHEMSGINASISERQSMNFVLQQRVEQLAKELEEKALLVESKEAEAQAHAVALQKLIDDLQDSLLPVHHNMLGLLEKYDPEGCPSIPAMEECSTDTPFLNTELLRLQAVVPHVKDLGGLTAGLRKVLESDACAITELRGRETELSGMANTLDAEVASLRPTVQALRQELGRARETEQRLLREIEAGEQQTRGCFHRLKAISELAEQAIFKRDSALSAVLQEFSRSEPNLSSACPPSPASASLRP
eukprot:RCo000477